MKKAETPSEINMSRSQPEIAGLIRLDPTGAVTLGPVASGEDEGGKIEGFPSSDTDFILIV
jgi:hypothetical protein